MKKLLLLIGMCVSIGFASAQRQTISKEYFKDAWDIPYSQMPGKLNYGYIVNPEGKNIKDGAYSIKCALTNYKYNYSIHTIVYNGSYSLTTTFKNGSLNGALTSNYKLAVTGSSFLGIDKGNISASMTGNFVNGVPNGALKVNRNGELITNLTANYKNGKLVGAYSCSLVDYDSRVQKYSGTLTQDSKFTGAWKFNDDAMTFSNGVLISKSSKDRSTPPAVSELAKKFAAGTITEEQLYKDGGCVVCVDSVNLGDLARIAIFRDSGVNFKELKGYNFSEPNYIKYKFLKKLATLTDDGYAQLLLCIWEYILNGSSSAMDYFSSTTIGEEIKYGCLLSGIYGRPCIYMHRSNNDGYAVGGFEDWYDYVYLSEDQSAQLENNIEELMIATAETLEECILRQIIELDMVTLGSEYDGNVPTKARIKAYFNGDKEVWNEYAEEYFEKNVKGETDEVKKAEAMSKYNTETAKALQGIEQTLTEVYDIYSKENEMHPTNSEYVVWKHLIRSSDSTYTTAYITKSSVEQFTAKLEQIKKEIDNLMIANAKTLEECILRKIKNPYMVASGWGYDNNVSTDARIKAYFNGNKEVWNESAEKYFENNVKGETDEVKKAEAMSMYNSETAKTLQGIEQILTEAYETFGKESEIHPTNSEYVVWKQLDITSGSHITTYTTTFIPKSSVDQFTAKLEQIANEIAEYQKAASEQEGIALSIAKDREKAAKVQAVMPVINFMREEKKPSGMVYGESSNNYFYTTSNNEYWRLDFEKQLKPFCPIIDVELVDIDDTNVVLKVTKQGKKKTIETYQISVQYDNRGRFCAESFDINKATQITE